MAGKKRKSVGPTPTMTPPPLGPQVEYHHLEDDAWYNVQLLLSGQTLTVKFMEFPEDQDEVFNVHDFTTLEQLSEFRNLFRPLSLQLEAVDCGMVKEGMNVCAISDLGHQGRRYFDAIVEAVKREEHTIVDETEECSCSFVLSWLHGPLVGTLTLASVEDLCLIQSHTCLDPRLACFLELAKWKHNIASPHDNLIIEDIAEKGPTLSSCTKCKSHSSIQKSKGRKWLGNAVPCGNIIEERNKEVDLLGANDSHAIVNHSSNFLDNLGENVLCYGLGKDDNLETEVMDIDARYFIVVENLEKDVSPSTIVRFIEKEIGLKIEAFVFLNLSSEPYTRGALVVNCVEDLERLCDFVVKPEQIIVSSKGRPWIVTNTSGTEYVRPSFWCLEQDLENVMKLSSSDGLKVVKFGSEEYSKAEKLRDLFLDFTNHQQNLSKTLALKEQHILDS